MEGDEKVTTGLMSGPRFWLSWGQGAGDRYNTGSLPDEVWTFGNMGPAQGWKWCTNNIEKDGADAASLPSHVGQRQSPAAI